MNLTAFLTDRCNMRCLYCFEGSKAGQMTSATAAKTVELAYDSKSKRGGISFFGGEPLLQTELISEMLRYSRKLSERDGGVFTYNMTTNGLLLSEPFLQLAREYGVKIALSHDGLSQDKMRILPGGEGTMRLLEDKIDLLLSYQPDAVVMSTVTPDTVSEFADSVRWLFERGFKRVNACIDYRAEAKWNEESFDILRRQYEIIAEDYYERIRGGEDVRFMGFDSKIKSRISEKCYECRLGMRQPSVSTEGKIYPCVQFCSVDEYCIGSVYTGIDYSKQAEIYNKSLKADEFCAQCGLKSRCRYNCACLNFQLTGDMNTVSPVQCTHERIIIPVADRLAERLYYEKNALFMKRFYNV